MKLHLEELIPPRVRLEKDTRVPAESASKGVSIMDPATHVAKLSTLMAKGNGKIDSNQGQQRRGHREAPATAPGTQREGVPGFFPLVVLTLAWPELRKMNLLHSVYSKNRRTTEECS